MDTHRPGTCDADDCTCEPFEFHCLYGDFKISGQKVEQKQSGKWIRIDKGNPDRIMPVVAPITAALCLFVMLMANVLSVFAPNDKPNLMRPSARPVKEATL